MSLQKIYELFGRVKVANAKGEVITYVWDYKNEKPRIESEMTEQEIKESQIAMFQKIITNLR